MKSREISWSKIRPFSLACTDPYISIGLAYQYTIEYNIRKAMQFMMLLWC